MKKNREKVSENVRQANLFVGKVLLAMICVAVITIALYFIGPLRNQKFSIQFNIMIALDNITRIILCIWIFASKGEDYRLKYAIAIHFILMAICFSYAWHTVLWPLFAMGVAYSVRYCSKKYTLSIGVSMLVIMTALQLVIMFETSGSAFLNDTNIFWESFAYFFPQIIAMIGFVIMLSYTAQSNMMFLKKDREARERLAVAAQDEMDRKALAERSRQLEIVGALSLDYLDTYLIDTTNKTTTAIKQGGVLVTEGHKLYGISRDFQQSAREYIKQFVHPDDLEYMLSVIELDNIKKQLEDKSTYKGQFRHIKDGEVHYFQFKYTAIEGTDKIISGFVNVDSMVAEEKKQKEELQRALEAEKTANMAKSNFLFNMSHDIRTPMNAIVGFSDLIAKNAEDTKKVRDYAEKIQSANNVLLNLINNVLELAQIESGKAVVEETLFDSEVFRQELYTVMEMPMKRKNLEYVDNADFRHKYMYGDVTKLEGIFLNLLSNAVKYSRDGGRVTFTSEELNGDKEGYIKVRTTVTDEGIGMTEEYLPRIFDNFSREKTTTESGVHGTGLGMSIVKKYVELMGGSILVTSEINVGTTFVVTIPHRISNEDPYDVSLNQETLSAGRFDGKKALLAEDNELNREIICNILSEIGFEVETAEDGVVCIDKLNSRPENYYDIIFMDVQMPNLSGYEATGYIRAEAEGYRRDIPIVAMTANAFKEDKENARKAGMNGHIAKPINMKEMLDTISKVLTK
ncbi:MAG: ATP-binding protein [Lachnospiraceae bacterium]|nr:ATP-binding protein [Lachnospiraceae bacterium]